LEDAKMKTRWCAKVPLGDGWYWCRYKVGSRIGTETVRCPCRVTLVYEKDKRRPGFLKPCNAIMRTSRGETFLDWKPEDMRKSGFKFGPKIEEPQP
jgi:hypothetical protein